MTEDERIFRNIDVGASDVMEIEPDEESVYQQLSLSELDCLHDLSPQERNSILKQLLMDEIGQAVAVATKNKCEIFFIEE